MAFPSPCIIRNAHSARRLYAQEEKVKMEGVGASNGDLLDDQKWCIEDAGDGTYTIRNFYSGRRLYAESNKGWEDGVGATSSVVVNDDQKWTIERRGDGTYTICNFHSARRLYAQGNKGWEQGVGASNGDFFADQTWLIESARH